MEPHSRKFQSLLWGKYGYFLELHNNKFNFSFLILYYTQKILTVLQLLSNSCILNEQSIRKLVMR